MVPSPHWMLKVCEVMFILKQPQNQLYKSHIITLSSHLISGQIFDKNSYCLVHHKYHFKITMVASTHRLMAQQWARLCVLFYLISYLDSKPSFIQVLLKPTDKAPQLYNHLKLTPPNIRPKYFDLNSTSRKGLNTLKLG